MSEPFTAIDWHLIQEAEAGNREALRVMAGECVESLTRIKGTDPATAWLAGIMARIAEGQSPDQAFGWKREGKPKGNLAFLQWNYARWVETLIAEHGVATLDAAKEIVGRAAGKSGEDGGTIDKAWKKYRRVQIPDDIFPIPDEVLRLVLKLDEHMRAEVARLAR
ncbi:hypothetical protein [Thiocapsa marina]|uniref:Uncharacterized protein n=1 Tax=Thiocapsa marina 5811 TaxID=768671 RepID=F9UAL9_9GAMM|nr:hypothetical protein [Thiocapsa marina]EGV18771.1 hypothetical protein ThimaDRAFT_2189 [Thiocapsa marina 5811]